MVSKNYLEEINLGTIEDYYTMVIDRFLNSPNFTLVKLLIFDLNKDQRKDFLDHISLINDQYEENELEPLSEYLVKQI